MLVEMTRLGQKIIKEVHGSALGGHSGILATYQTRGVCIGPE
jgi:hypothetical protein